MGMLIGGLLSCLAVGFGLTFVIDNLIGDKHEYNTTKGGFISVVLTLIWLVLECITVVPAGNVGVQVTFGEVSKNTLSEGLHLINPLSDVHNVSVRMVSTTLENSQAGTKDLQQVHTNIVVNYRLQGDKAAHIYKEFGLDLKDRVVLPILNESFKAVTAHYTSEELITKRDEVSERIRAEASTKMAQYDISVSSISLVNFGFSPEYQKAIEQKVIATQAKLKADADLERIKVEAQQAIAKAKGEAEAIAIQAQAINSQGGASFVQLKAIEKWDGKLPTTNAGGTVPFINLR